MKPQSWLTTADAALHLGFVDVEGKPDVHRFASWKNRLKAQGIMVPTYRITGTTRSLRYRQVDLDRYVEPQQMTGSLVEAARHLRVVRAPAREADGHRPSVARSQSGRTAAGAIA